MNERTWRESAQVMQLKIVLPIPNAVVAQMHAILFVIHSVCTRVRSLDVSPA